MAQKRLDLFFGFFRGTLLLQCQSRFFLCFLVAVLALAHGDIFLVEWLWRLMDDNA
jgi:hypothetical protein